MRFSARILFGFFLFFIVSFFIASKTFAQTVPPATSSAAPNQYAATSTNSDVPNNLHTYTQNVMIETMSALICQMAGIDPVNPNQKCLGVDPQTGKVGFVQNGGGVIGLMTNAITMLYTPPINSREYFQNLASNFGVVKTAQASDSGCDQAPHGLGFCGISPLLGLWTAMRNIVYLLFILVFIVIGFAIMIRAKIDPRTVMTIQNQIPKLIVGILLVTFSFAIAGFLIDVMYTSIYLLGNTIVQTDPQISGTGQPDKVSAIAGSANTFAAADKVESLGNLANDPAESVAGIIAPLFDNGFGKALMTGFGVVGGAAAGTAVIPFFGTVIGAVLGGVAGNAASSQVAGAVSWGIAFFVIIVALIWALFRLWFSLIKAYLFFIINVVFAPFWILIGLFPGAQLSFGNWLREIISDLAVFPAVVVMFLMAKVFIDQFGKSITAHDQIFSPPMIGGLANPQSFGALIGMGMILLTPSLLDKIKSAIKAPQVDLSPVYNALGVGGGAPGGISHGISSFGFTLAGMKSVPFLKDLPGIKNAAETAHGPSH